MAVTAAAVPEAPQSMNAFARVIGAIVSPRATFKDIARKPGWLLPLLLFIICSCAITSIFTQRVGWRAFMEKQDLQSRRAQQQMAQMSPEQREHMLQIQTKAGPIVGYVFDFVGFPIVMLVIAAIFMGIFNATAGASMNFKTSFGIVTHAWIPFLLSALLGVLVMFLKPPDTINVQNLVASNVAALMSNSAPRWLQTIGESLDIFTFWVLGLMAFGYAVARPKKLSMGTTLGWVIGIWVVYVLVKAGLAAVFA